MNKYDRIRISENETLKNQNICILSAVYICKTYHNLHAYSYLCTIVNHLPDYILNADQCRH